MTSQSFHADMFGLMRRRLSGAAALLAALPAFAIDGVTLIDQNKTFAGNVTPGDAPGFPITRGNYFRNTFAENRLGGTKGGVNQGQNVCDGVPCAGAQF